MPHSKPPKTSTGPASAPLAAFDPAVAQAWMDITLQCTRFAMDRVQKDLAAQRAMIACATPGDLMTLQARYCQDTAQEYADQAARMVELMTAAMGQDASDGASPFSRRYDDIPL